MPLFKQTSGHGPWLALNQTSPQQKSYNFMFDRLISPFFHDFSSILLFFLGGIPIIFEPQPSELSFSCHFRTSTWFPSRRVLNVRGLWWLKNTERKDQSMTWPTVEVIISTRYFKPMSYIHNVFFEVMF